MKKAFATFLVVCILLAGFWVLPVWGGEEYSQSENAESSIIGRSIRGNTLNVGSGQTYSKIQDAIDNASSGDTVRVWAGTYYERVVINKRIDLIGSGSINTILNGSNKGSVVTVNADGCNISGFNITGTGPGSGVYWPNYAGILIQANRTIVTNCTCNLNEVGIYLFGSNNNTISDCIFNSNNFHGINITNSFHNNISNCSFSFNIMGIALSNSDENIIDNNSFNKNDPYGIELMESYHNTILYNNFSLYKDSSLNFDGICACSATHSNLIYLNNFFSNLKGGTLSSDFSPGTNFWNGSTKGNYWSNYVFHNPSATNNGIVWGTPMGVKGFGNAFDYYPLVNPVPLNFTTSNPPIIITTNILTAINGILYSVNYSATDPDTPQNQLIWTMNTNASWLSFSSDQELTGTPSTSDIGSYWVYISVSDGDHYDSTNFTLTVMGKPLPPIPFNGSVFILRTGQRYNRIQDAIDNASSGDTIRVYAGTYKERIDIYKSLHLIGNGTNDTFIQGPNLYNVTGIERDNCSISGFSITGSGISPWDSGIAIYGAKNCNISECNLSGNINGIVLQNADYNSISNNILDGNKRCGIFYNFQFGYEFSNNNTIKNNQIVNNGKHGIYIDSGCTFNNIYLNNFINNNAYNSQAQDNGENNSWNLSTMGNYWSDWTTPDKDNDGIVDVPYNISGLGGAKDHFPLAKPVSISSQPPPNMIGRVLIERTQQRFVKIQDAIDNASSGDTIHVWAGFYYENVVIDKTLTLKGNGTTTIVNGNNKGTVFKITADHCNISNLNITGTGPRYSGYLSNYAGILLQSNFNTVRNCTSFSNEVGIYIYDKGYNKIIDCICFSNFYHGINLTSSSNNYISSCVFNLNLVGMGFASADANTIENNNISLNDFYGLELHSSEGNTFTNNTIDSNRKFGAMLTERSGYNSIYLNNFVNNNDGGKQAIDTFNKNDWNTTNMGNYWSDWITPDKDNDGIVDIPYNISGGGAKDHFPLTKPGSIPSPPPQKYIGRVIIERTQQKYVKIQDAIDNASSGDTIRVWAGTYRECIKLDKKLSLIGNSSANTIMDSWGILDKDTITITANNCLVEGFYLTGNGSAIIIESDGNIIRNCISGETVERAIGLGNANRNSISNFKIYSNVSGISVYRSGNNTFTGIYSDPVEGAGISMAFSNYNSITNSTFNNLLMSGVEMSGSYYNLFRHNTFSLKNTKQELIFIWSGEFNTFHSNNFHNDRYTIEATDSGKNNYWNKTNKGNYWSDWTTPDKDNDGIVDLPRNIKGEAGAKDYYPLTNEIQTPIDITPDIQDTNIKHNSENVSTSTKEIVITFYDPMNTSSVEAALSISPNINYTLVWSESKNVLKIIFGENLSFNTTYSITLDSQAKDSNGNPLDSPFKLVFTTESEDKGDTQDPNGEGDWDLIFIYGIITVVIIIIIFLVVLGFIVKKRRIRHDGQAQIPGGSKVMDKQYTYTNGVDEFVVELKQEALVSNKPSDFGLTKQEMLERFKKKFEKGELSQETYNSIKDSLISDKP